jgi:hypothetical protein
VIAEPEAIADMSGGISKGEKKKCRECDRPSISFKLDQVSSSRIAGESQQEGSAQKDVRRH